MSTTEVCSKCGKEKPIEEFGWKNSLLGKRHRVCKSCTAVRSRKWYYENKEHHIQTVRANRQEYRQSAREYILDYLSTHPCVDCGETDPIVLEFDHVRGEKSSELSRLIGRGKSLEAIKTEIEKCEVRCSNCHRRRTAKEQGWFRWR